MTIAISQVANPPCINIENVYLCVGFLAWTNAWIIPEKSKLFLIFLFIRAHDQEHFFAFALWLNAHSISLMIISKEKKEKVGHPSNNTLQYLAWECNDFNQLFQRVAWIVRCYLPRLLFFHDIISKRN